MEEYKSSDGIATREFKRLRNIIRTHSVTASKQQQEIAELKTKIELMRDISLSSNYDDIYHLIDALADAINKTPKQCLASVKADFIKSTISDIEIGMANAHLGGDDILEYLNLELNKIN